MTAILYSAAAFPLLILVGFYAVWLMAWGILGHRPVYYPSGSDDPKLVLGNAYYPAAMLFVLFPLGMVLGLGGVVIHWITRRAPGRAILWAAALVGLWVVFWALVSWDPYGAIEWLAD